MAITQLRGLMSRLHYLRLIVVGIVAAAISGCSSLNSKVGGALNLDTDVRLQFIAEADINPDEKNRPSPLFIRLYELKTTRQFERANFIDLYERDKEVLGADLIAKQTLKRLKPGDERTDTLVLNAQTRYVGLVAEFFQYQKATFKVVIPIAAENVVASSSVIRVAGNAIAIKE